MNFLLICHKLSDLAGTTSQAIRLSKLLTERKHTVILCGEGELPIEKGRILVISIMPTNNPKKFAKDIYSKTLNLVKIKKIKIDYVQAFDPLYAARASKYISDYFNIPQILRLGAIYEDFYAAKIILRLNLPKSKYILRVFSSLLFIYFRRNIYNFDFLYANCHFLANHYATKINRKLYIKVINNLVFPLSNQTSLPTDKYHNENKLKLLFVGRIEPRKNVLELIQSVREIENCDKDISLTIVGSGNKNPSYTKMVKMLVRNNLNLPVYFKDFVNPDLMFQVYKEHHVTIFPTTDEHFPMTEGMPNVILESLACNVPVIATSVAGVPELLSDGLDMFLINPAFLKKELIEKINWFATLNIDELSDYLETIHYKMMNYTDCSIYKKYIKMVNLSD